MPTRIRNIKISSNVPDGSTPSGCARGGASLKWYQAETVRILLSMHDNNFPVPLESDSTVKMEAWLGNALGTLYINKAGTLINEDGGTVRVDLSMAESNLPAGSYNYHIKVFDATGEEEMGVAAAGILQVISSPNSAAADYVGTSPAVQTAWGEIEGELEEQTDLLEVLNAKASKKETNAEVSDYGLRFWNPDQNKFQRVRLRGSANAEYLEIADEV